MDENKVHTNTEYIIEPKEGFILLEHFEMPVEQGKLILTSTSVKPTQIYRVISDRDDSCFFVDDLVYIKSYPTPILIKGKQYFIAEEDNVIAKVMLCQL
jgi:hypothetical protein